MFFKNSQQTANSKIFIDFIKQPTNGTILSSMPRQNTCPADFPPAILAQIEQAAQRIVATRKSRGETQAQWAEKLGISQPTMARLERGDPAIATATYVMCLWLVNPQLNLCSLLDGKAYSAPIPTNPLATTATDAPTAGRPPRSHASGVEEFAALFHSFPVQKAQP